MSVLTAEQIATINRPGNYRTGHPGNYRIGQMCDLLDTITDLQSRLAQKDAEIAAAWQKVADEIASWTATKSGISVEPTRREMASHIISLIPAHARAAQAARDAEIIGKTLKAAIALVNRKPIDDPFIATRHEVAELNASLQLRSMSDRMKGQEDAGMGDNVAHERS